jgi:pimeloyl-ACP methyl ester carboxylesterase
MAFRLTCLILSLLLCPLEAETLVRPDGTAITYYLERPAQETYPLVVILQGSECLRVSHKYLDYIQVLSDQGVGVLRVEKPGLHTGVAIGDCTDEYLRLNTPQRRVLDLVMVVAQLRQDESWDGRLVLVGGSEGAMIAALTAPLLPETQAVVLLSGGGGLTFGEEVVEGAARQMLDSGMEPENVEKEIAAMREFLANISENPDPFKEWMSDGKLVRNTYLWWAHAVPLRLTTSLQRVEAPVLVLHGRSDLGTPYRSAEMMMEELSFAGKTNIEFRPYEGGHTPPNDEILKALDWAAERLR